MKINGNKTTQALCTILCAFLIIGCSTLRSANNTQVKADMGPMYEAGTGRNDITLAILRPRGIALAPGQEKYLDILQGALISDFNKFSAIQLFDSKNIEQILNQQQLSLSGNYSEKDYIRIGELLNAKFILVGTLTRIESQFDFDLSLTEVEKGLLVTSFKKTIKLREIVNSSASRAAAASMLPRLGVVFTPEGKLALETELSAEETESQNALALSYEAARSGNLIDALIYSYAAEDADRNSTAARQQASEAFARMGGSGTAIKEDIKRQEFWKKNLIAFEEFYRTHPPFELVYTATDISKGVTDHDAGTTNFEFYVGLRHKSVATMQKVLNDILKELRQTDYKKNKWGFDNWPRISAVSTRSNQIYSDIFNNYLTFNITAVLLNDNDETIAKLDFPLYGQLMLSGQSTIGAFSTQERRMALTVPNEMVLRTENIYFRLISINGYDADTANVNKYLRNSVVVRMPIKSRISIPADKQIVPEFPEDREKRLAAQQKEKSKQEGRAAKQNEQDANYLAKQREKAAENRDRQQQIEARRRARDEVWNTKKLSSRGNIAAGISIPNQVKPGENPLAMEFGLGLGYRNFSLDGRLVYPIGPIKDNVSILGFGAALGYSYVWNNFIASLEGGATWYRENNGKYKTVAVPTLEGKFDMVPWKPGLGLRLGYKLEFGFPKNGGLYPLMFRPDNTFGSGSTRMIGSLSTGIVLWL